MYFKNFPKIFYDFNATGESTNTNTLQILTDITANVRVRKKIMENITLYDEYDMMDGETPELVAEKFYGNPELHWVIMLVNQRYDYLEDFPMSSAEIEEYVIDKYGEDGKYKVHHYEKNGIVVEGKATLKVPIDTVSPVNIFKQHDFIINSDETANARVESIDTQNRLLYITIDYGRFEPNDIITVKGFRTNEETAESFFDNLVFAFTAPQNCFTLSTGYTPITNYDYETAENEKKRRIKIISPNLISSIVRELETLMA